MSNKPCPYLPEPSANNHRTLGRHGKKRDAEFYFDALSYGQRLWLQGHAGRAILAITRALYANLDPGDDILTDWPLPYAALSWIMKTHPSGEFPGNPRISFQHQATRIQGQQKEIRSARAWAVWALACKAKPQLVGDASQGIIEPNLNEISGLLNTYGHPSEDSLWRAALDQPSA